MAKRKTKSIAKLIDDAAVITQRIVRMKAADDTGYATCVTCGRVCHWKDMDGGHYIPRRHLIHKLSEENIHPQCKGCNGFKGGAYQEYTLFMVDTYGRDFVDTLISTKNDIKKWNRPDIMVHIQELKEYERQIRSAKGL